MGRDELLRALVVGKTLINEIISKIIISLNFAIIPLKFYPALSRPSLAPFAAAPPIVFLLVAFTL